MSRDFHYDTVSRRALDFPRAISSSLYCNSPFYEEPEPNFARLLEFLHAHPGR
jgi:hypothetical protein